MAGTAVQVILTTMNATRARVSQAKARHSQRNVMLAARCAGEGGCAMAFDSAKVPSGRSGSVRVAGHGHVLDGGLHLLRHRPRQRDVAERFRLLLAVGERVLDEVLQDVELP